MDTPTNDTPADEPTLASQQAEIERLRALLQAVEARTAPVETQIPDRLASVLEALSERLTRTDPPAAPATPAAPAKSAKIPDPPILTDGKDPTFDSWKLQIRDKL